MKKIEELAISPYPWRSVATHHEPNQQVVFTRGVLKGFMIHHTVSVKKTKRKERNANARLIAAAPELYKSLREAVIEMCHNCQNCNYHERDGEGEYGCAELPGHCYVQGWRQALAKAAGEEVEE